MSIIESSFPEQKDDGEEERGQILKTIECEGFKAVVRYAREKNLGAVLEIIQDHYDNRKKHGDPEKRVESFDRGQWMKVLSGEDAAVALVVEVDGNVCGDILVEKTMEQASRYAQYWILIFNVTEKFEGKGLGKALIESAIEETKKMFNAESIGLSVNGGNIRAVKMYEKLGFKKVDSTEGDNMWHGKPSKSFFMTKQI